MRRSSRPNKGKPPSKYGFEEDSPSPTGRTASSVVNDSRGSILTSASKSLLKSQLAQAKETAHLAQEALGAGSTWRRKHFVLNRGSKSCSTNSASPVRWTLCRFPITRGRKELRIAPPSRMRRLSSLGEQTICRGSSIVLCLLRVVQVPLPPKLLNDN